MKQRKPKIIKDKKLRGEWAESVFMARAGEHGLPVSKPWGEMCSYDFIIGKTGRFASVQVKSTICQLNNGYECTVRGGHKAYPAGSFDFVAAYVIPDDAWYIIPAKSIRGKKSIMLYPKSQTAKYGGCREAWHLLREASEASSEVSGNGEIVAEDSSAAECLQSHSAGALGRLEEAMNYFKQRLEGSNVDPQKRE